MAKIIKFYVPQSFGKVSKRLPSGERGKLLEFPVAILKSASDGPDTQQKWLILPA
jgi:hypothetical protein